MQATLDILSKRWANAEQRYLQVGLVDDAVAAYLECQRWPDAVRLAEENHHYDLDKLRAGYMEYLLTTKQLEAAGRVCEREGNIQVRRAVRGHAAPVFRTLHESRPPVCAPSRPCEARGHSDPLLGGGLRACGPRQTTATAA